MRDIIMVEAKEILTRLMESIGESNSRNYYQGRIDALSWVLKQLPEEG
jgi:hypothetical protein